MTGTTQLQASTQDGHVEAPEVRLARRWMTLAIAALLCSGLLSLALVIARMPPFDRMVGDPLFFRRCLVVHVVLALVVWVHAFSAGLVSMGAPPNTASLTARLSPWVGAAALGLLLASSAAVGARPVLSNYVPMIDHPVFGAGLVVFAVAVLLAVVDGRLLRLDVGRGSLLRVPPPAVPGMRSVSLLLVATALTFFASWSAAPAGLLPETLFELANWGGGHVLQASSTAAMLTVWVFLGSHVIGRPIVSRRASAVVFAVLTLPWLASPVIALAGIHDAWAHEAFTFLMRWALWPAVLMMLVLMVRGSRGCGLRQRLSQPSMMGLIASVTLAIAGFVLGACIRGSTTLVPAHYHASIGAVTASFMTLAYVVVARLGASLGVSRVVQWQPAIFGFGQLVFALGFGFAGVHGMARKTYGAEQLERTGLETLGLFVMGLGGIVAVAGGLLFLRNMVVAWRQIHAARPVERNARTRRWAWTP